MKIINSTKKCSQCGGDAKLQHTEIFVHKSQLFPDNERIIGKVTIALCERCIKQQWKKLLEKRLKIRIFFVLLFFIIGAYILIGPITEKNAVLLPLLIIFFIIFYTFRLIFDKMILTKEIFSNHFMKLPYGVLESQYFKNSLYEERLCQSLPEIPITDHKKTFSCIYPEVKWIINVDCDVCKEKVTKEEALLWPLIATLFYERWKLEMGLLGLEKIKLEYSDFKEIMFNVCEKCFLKHKPLLFDLLDSLKKFVQEKAKPLFQDQKEWKKWGFISEESVKITVITLNDFKYLLENFEIFKTVRK